MKTDVKTFHVLHDYKRKVWDVKIDYDKEAVFTNHDNAMCIAEAKRLAQGSTAPKRRVLVHGTNGGIVEQVDYCVDENM